MLDMQEEWRGSWAGSEGGEEVGLVMASANKFINILMWTIWTIFKTMWFF